MLTVLTNLIQYYIFLGKYLPRNTFRYGPASAITIAAFLLMVHPTAILLKDLKLITPVCSTAAGRVFLIACTHVGFIMLWIGAIWVLQVFPVLRNKCCCVR